MTKKVLHCFVEAILFVALGVLLVGCGEGKADPKAEAPPPAQEQPKGQGEEKKLPEKKDEKKEPDAEQKQEKN